MQQLLPPIGRDLAYSYFLSKMPSVLQLQTVNLWWNTWSPFSLHQIWPDHSILPGSNQLYTNHLSLGIEWRSRENMWKRMITSRVTSHQIHYCIHYCILHSYNLPAIVAGIAPRDLIMEDMSLARLIFSGWGSPCANIVDSNATTAFPDERASDTSGRIFRREDAVYFLILKKVDAFVAQQRARKPTIDIGDIDMETEIKW